MADGILTKGAKLFARGLYNGTTKSNVYQLITGMYELPDITGQSERVEITTLDDSVRKYIPGIIDYDNLSIKFIWNDDGIISGCNTNFECLKKTKDKGDPVHFCFYIPEPTGDDKFTTVEFDAKFDLGIVGQGINDRTEFQIDLSLQSNMTYTCNVDGYPSTVATPAMTPGGTFTGSKEITLTCATQGASIYYTDDGSVPTSLSTLYSAPFTITATKTIKCFALKDGFNDSNVNTATYTLQE